MSFKEDVAGLVALCNSINLHHQTKAYTVTDHPLDEYQVVVAADGARTIKVMMAIARGGSVVSKQWVNHSIKGKKWLNPLQFEMKEWKDTLEKARNARWTRRRRRRKKDEVGVYV